MHYDTGNDPPFPRRHSRGPHGNPVLSHPSGGKPAPLSSQKYTTPPPSFSPSLPSVILAEGGNPVLCTRPRLDSRARPENDGGRKTHGTENGGLDSRARPENDGERKDTRDNNGNTHTACTASPSLPSFSPSLSPPSFSWPPRESSPVPSVRRETRTIEFTKIHNPPLRHSRQQAGIQSCVRAQELDGTGDYTCTLCTSPFSSIFQLWMAL